MAFADGLLLKGVTKLDRKELGRGAYGRVYAVNYCGTICAAKEIHSILVEEVGEVEMRLTVESFMRECDQCSALRHPNLVQFLGVYYPSAGADGRARGKMRLPVMVMEMMADSLTSLVKKHDKIPVHIKFSIVHDVSFGLCYLHNHDPPIVHRDLSPNNVLVTVHNVAKISDLGVAKVIKADSRKTMTKAPGTGDFMPPECVTNNPKYGLPMDVFSFAGIILHTFNQSWPYPTEQVQFDSETRTMVAFSEVERRQQYLDKLRQEAEVFRPLVEKCLDNDPAVRPTMATVCEKIQLIKGDIVKESPPDVITLYQQVELLKSEVEQHNTELQNDQQMKKEIKQLQSEVDDLTQQLEEPPLMSALSYRIKWTQLADLPVPMYGAYVTVKDKKVYVAGGDSPIKGAYHQIYVYDVDTDHWGHLPPSDHYYGVPHIIGGKLAIIGGRLSANKKRTNRVTTFQETSESWTSYYPNLVSVRRKPGVATHLEYAIVAGGGSDDMTRDDIEVLNWVENLHWKKVSINLPVPMYGFTPIIADDDLVVVGFNDDDMKRDKRAYRIAVDDITKSGDQQQTRGAPTQWITMTASTHWHTALIPNSSPPVVVGGEDQSRTSTVSDIKMYDDRIKSWRNIDGLPIAKSHVAIATVSDNAIIVIGGFTEGRNADSSCLTTVELGQARSIY